MASPHINPQTGLFYRATMEIILEHEMARSSRYPEPLTLLHLAINLHPTPTSEIKTLTQSLIAELVNTNLRASDAPGEDKDDYIIILPGTPALGGAVLASRLLHRVKILHPDATTKIIAYIGLTTDDGRTANTTQTLFAQAEIALTESKQRGPYSIVNYNDLTH